MKLLGSKLLRVASVDGATGKWEEPALLQEFQSAQAAPFRTSLMLKLSSLIIGLAGRESESFKGGRMAAIERKCARRAAAWIAPSLRNQSAISSRSGRKTSDRWQRSNPKIFYCR